MNWVQSLSLNKTFLICRSAPIKSVPKFSFTCEYSVSTILFLDIYYKRVVGSPKLLLANHPVAIYFDSYGGLPRWRWVKEPGKINEVSYRSGKYYIIAGSFSNYNLSLNKANDLAENGFNVIIISPINQNNMYRVAVNTYDEINNAKKNLSLYKEKLNNELWILKHWYYNF